MTIAVEFDNPYWDAVKNDVDIAASLWGTPTVGGWSRYRRGPGNIDFDAWAREGLKRSEHVKRYAWTITDPVTVAFVAEHSGGRLVDPMAGTGYWGYVLGQRGVDVVSYDIAPGTNHYHEGAELYAVVEQAAGVDAVAMHPDRTLLLAWPPYSRPDGVEVVRAHRGGRVIFIGEGDGGCTGDDALFAEFESGWTEVASHAPVQWDGIHDVVTVYDRR